MEIDEKALVAVCIAFALFGMALLLLFSESPKRVSISQALVLEENSYVMVSGSVHNISRSDWKFYLCEEACIRVRAGDIPSSRLLFEGSRAVVVGRIAEYQKNKYVEASKISLQ
ncbi:MAG: hypothetical protein N3G22_02040 [Candidatus Micrarchaeota archaeon]|nr:hypothetical protein [Candidatus Micrarchaeota archaeon]